MTVAAPVSRATALGDHQGRAACRCSAAQPAGVSDRRTDDRTDLARMGAAGHRR
jgi:hypothetical protein